MNLKQLKNRLKIPVDEINKDIQTIFYSEPYPFRERTHVILIGEDETLYYIPDGEVLEVKLDGKRIKEEDYELYDGQLEISEDITKGLITIDYLTYAIGEDVTGHELRTLSNDTDSLNMPSYLEELFITVIEQLEMFKKYTGLRINK